MRPRDITNLPPELATEILLLLPAKTLFGIKCVSKGWNNFISQPSFQKQYRKSCLQSKHDISAFFFYVAQEEEALPYAQEYYYPSACGPVLSVNFPNRKGNSLDYLDKLGYIVASSNGLFLLSPSYATYYVCDPLTRKYIELPRTKRTYDSAAIGFICEINDSNDEFSMHYKVMCVEEHKSMKTHVIETYSSETGEWKESLVTASSKFRFWSKVATLVNGSFYWTDWVRHRSVVYDPKNIKGRLKLIELPDPMYEDYPGLEGWGEMLCESREGKVQLIQFGAEMEIWVLNQETSDESDIISKSSWALIYRIDSTYAGYDTTTDILMLICVNLVDDHEKVVFVNGNKLFSIDWQTNSTETVATFDFRPSRFIKYKQQIWPLLL